MPSDHSVLGSLTSHVSHMVKVSKEKGDARQRDEESLRLHKGRKVESLDWSTTAEVQRISSLDSLNKPPLTA